MVLSPQPTHHEVCQRASGNPQKLCQARDHRFREEERRHPVGHVRALVGEPPIAVDKIEHLLQECTAQVLEDRSVSHHVRNDRVMTNVNLYVEIVTSDGTL